VLAGAAVTLDGSGSADADGDPLAFRWSLLSRPSGSIAVLSDPTAAGPGFVADLAGLYVAQLVVDDGLVESDPDTVAIDAREPIFVTVTASDAEAAEAGPVPGTFTFARTGDPSRSLDVLVARGGTADDGDDYESLGGATFLVTFAAGEPTAEVTVTPRPDNRLEGDETVVLTVQPASGYLVGTPDAATVTIADDPPVVTVTASDPDASEKGPDPGVFTFARTGGDLAASLTARYALGGTASNSADYAFLGSSVTIPAGQATGELVIDPKPDNVVEGPETVVVTLEPSSGYLVGDPASATVVIADDPAVVTAVATDADASEAGPDPGEVTITRSGGDLASALQVLVARGGSATNGIDYVGIGGASFLVGIAAGAATAVVAIEPLDDTLVEGPETVVLTVQPRTAYLVGIPDTATVTIADDD
jgi:pyrimidine deaminase RibD-like protein